MGLAIFLSSFMEWLEWWKAMKARPTIGGGGGVDLQGEAEGIKRAVWKRSGGDPLGGVLSEIYRQGE